MTITNPLLTRRAVVLAGMEATYRDPAVLGATDAVLVENPQYSIDAESLERNFVRNDLSPLARVIGRKQASMTFTTELRGSGFQNSGLLSDMPKLADLFRASGYSLTLMASAELSPVHEIGTHRNKVSFVDGSVLTSTDLIAYHLEVTTGGASGVAEITVTSDTVGEESAAQVVTDGAPFTFGTKGVSLTPTLSGDLTVGQKWTVWAYPPGGRLDPVSDNFESCSLEMYLDGVLHQMHGCFGTFNITAQAGQYAQIEWTFRGTYVAPVDAPFPAGIEFETALPPIVELARLRVDNFYAIVNQFTFTQNNDIQVRPDVSSEEGYVGQRIVGRNTEGGIDPEAELVADHDFWDRMSRATRMPFQMRIGQEAGQSVWMLAPSVQYTGLTYGDRNQIRTYDAGLLFSRSKGDDEFVVILA